MRGALALLQTESMLHRVKPDHCSSHLRSCFQLMPGHQAINVSLYSVHVLT